MCYLLVEFYLTLKQMFKELMELDKPQNIKII